MPAKEADAPPSAIGEPTTSGDAPVTQETTSEKRVTLATTGGVDEFKSPDGSFPTVVPGGTEMSETEAKAAKAAAAVMWLELRTVGGRGN